MFVNLHTLPAGQSMFTVYIKSKGAPLEEAEEVDVVAPHVVPAHRHLAAEVIERSRADVVRDYGPTAEVIGVANQSTGEVIFDCRARGHVPLPLVLPARALNTFERPYDALLDLARDEADLGNGSGGYRDWLLEVTP